MILDMPDAVIDAVVEILKAEDPYWRSATQPFRVGLVRETEQARAD